MTGLDCPNESKLKQGLGFHIMNYRAQLMGGRLEIDSPQGRRHMCVVLFADPAHRRQAKLRKMAAKRSATKVRNGSHPLSP